MAIIRGKNFDKMRAEAHSLHWGTAISESEELIRNQTAQYLFDVARSNKALKQLVSLTRYPIGEGRIYYSENMWSHKSLTFHDGPLPDNTPADKKAIVNNIFFLSDESTYYSQTGIYNFLYDIKEKPLSLARDNIKIYDCVYEYDSKGNPFACYSLRHRGIAMTTMDWNYFFKSSLLKVWSDAECSKREARWEELTQDRSLDEPHDNCPIYRSMVEEILHWIRYSKHIPDQFPDFYPNMRAMMARQKAFVHQLNINIQTLVRSKSE